MKVIYRKKTYEFVAVDLSEDDKIIIKDKAGVEKKIPTSRATFEFVIEEPTTESEK